MPVKAGLSPNRAFPGVAAGARRQRKTARAQHRRRADVSMLTLLTFVDES